MTYLALKEKILAYTQHGQALRILCTVNKPLTRGKHCRISLRGRPLEGSISGTENRVVSTDSGGSDSGKLVSNRYRASVTENQSSGDEWNSSGPGAWVYSMPPGYALETIKSLSHMHLQSQQQQESVWEKPMNEQSSGGDSRAPAGPRPGPAWCLCLKLVSSLCRNFNDLTGQAVLP